MNGTSERTTPRLGRGVVTVIAIVVSGAIITVLDATIVSVAIARLSGSFHRPVATIQWVMTGYMLAMAAVIPLTGFAVDKYGGKRVWMAAVGLFVAGSALAGVAWSAESLIVFRILQGLGGGMVAPVGMTLVAQAAGPQRMGRAMGMVGIPMMAGPVLGPVIGGVLVSVAGWRWIFLVNLPIGLVTLLWSHRSLVTAPGRPAGRLDVTGLLLLSPGLAALVYGLTELSASIPRSAAWLAGGVAALLAFVAYALGASAPLLNLRHFARRTFTAAALIQFVMGAVLIGAMLLLPLYFQVARGESAWTTGLLLVPEGAGAAIALSLTGRQADRGHGKAIVFIGIALLSMGFAALTQASAQPGYPVLLASLLVMGLGTGCLMAPVSAAAYSVLKRSEIPQATAMLNITQRVGGVLGTAVCAVVLQHHLSGPGHGTEHVAGAFGATFWWPLAVAALALGPALLLPGSRRPGQEAPRQVAPGQSTTADSAVGSIQAEGTT
jgi:EmrB/QacA subfamily drug resistance transporter